MGKTSLIKEWVRRVNRSPSSGDGPAIHAVEYAIARTDTDSAAKLLERLSSQLANSIESYGELIQRQSGAEQHYHINPIQQVESNTGTVIAVQIQVSVSRRFRSEDYRTLMRAQFEELHREGRLPASGVTVVIDGLDEVAFDPDNDELPFAEAVSRTHAGAHARPVPGLRLLVTARTATATSLLQHFPSFDLVRDEPSASSDLADFVAAQLAPVHQPLRDTLVERIVAYCEGRFVLAQALTDHVISAHSDGVAPTELADLVELPSPESTAPAWQTLLGKFGDSDHLRDQRYLPVLRIAALARDDGLPDEVFRAAVGRDNPGLQRQLGKILNELRDLFRPAGHPGALRRLCHVSLDDYLTGSRDSSSDSDDMVAQEHLSIATVLRERTRWNGSGEEVAEYAQKHLFTHLVAAIPADKTAVQQVTQELLGQLEFIEAVTRRLGIEQFQWELERLGAAFDHQVRPVNDLAFLLGRQIAQLRNFGSETDEGFLLRQLLHAARACGADTAESYRSELEARSVPGLETVWATGGQELVSGVRKFEHGHAPVSAVAMVDECRFVTASDDGLASLWDMRSGQRRCLPGDGSRIEAVAASASWVLTGSGRGTVQIWNVETDTPRPSPFRACGRVVALAISPDGERGVSLSRGGPLWVWHLRDARELKCVKPHELAPHEREEYRPTIMAVAAGRVLTGAANGCIVVADLQDTSQQLVLRHPGDDLTAAALSPDGRYAVTGGAEGEVILWDLAKQGCPHPLPDQEASTDLRDDSAEIPPVDSRVTALVVSNDRFVVAGSSVGARLWDAKRDAGELLVAGTGVSALALVPSGEHVVTASLDHRLRLWSLSSRRLLHVFHGHRDRVRSLAVDKSGRRMVSVSYDGTARLWHVPVAAVGRILQGYPACPTAMSWTADGAGVVVADTGGTIWRRNLVNGRGEKPGRASTGRVTALIPAAGKRRMAVGTAERTAEGTTKGITGVWDVDTAAFVNIVEPHSARVTALVAVSDDWAVATHADGLARLWHRGTAESLRFIRYSRGFTAAAATRLDGAPAVLLAADDHTVRLWDVRSHTWRWERPGHAMSVQSIAVCADDEYAVMAALDGAVRLWRVSDGRSWDFNAAHRAEATTVMAGPGMLAVSGAREGSAIVWNLRERTARHHLDHGPAVDAVTAVAFTPNGRHVVTGATDGGVRLWDVGAMASRRPPHPRVLLMLDGAVTHLLVAPAGDRAVIATATGQLTCVELP